MGAEVGKFCFKTARGIATKLLAMQMQVMSSIVFVEFQHFAICELGLSKDRSRFHDCVRNSTEGKCNAGIGACRYFIEEEESRLRILLAAGSFPRA
jgi:hypothetical protein